MEERKCYGGTSIKAEPYEVFDIESIEKDRYEEQIRELKETVKRYESHPCFDNLRQEGIGNA
ncbi:hypothetical protein Goe25_00200 [Bacillus phage vB_BsuM-Goe25]|nr:hypothetical protein Goe25_00200 [Bacillus phage vB_BsuM-Goe25]